MDIKQIAQFVNEATQEITGETALIQEDLSNVVEAGDTLANVGGIDAYVRNLPNVIGKYLFVNRKYNGSAPSVLMDGWEFGSILGKIRATLPDAEINESWELQDNAAYDMQVFHKPDVSAKFFNKLVTFEIPLSICERQVKQSFHSAGELSAFIEMLYNEIEKKMTIALDGLIMRTINNFAAETIYNGVGTTYANTSIRAVNLLNLYNTNHSGATLTVAEAMESPEFIRFAVYTMGLYRDRMSKISTLFNMGGTEKFTPTEMQKMVLLSDFARAARVFLYDANGQFKSDNLSFGDFDTVPMWQGSGTSYSFTDVSTINVTTTESHSINCSGVLGVLFDRDAIAVCNRNRRTTTAPYNAKGEFWNSYFKSDAEYINDFDENGVVFYIHA